MLQSIANLMFPGVDYNIITELLGEYLCKVFRYIEESGRFNRNNEVAAQDESFH